MDQKRHQTEDQDQSSQDAQASPSDQKSQQDKEAHAATPGEEKTEDQQDERLADERIQELEEKAQSYYDKYLRLNAEFDNFRRRTNKEKYEIIQQASKELVEELLPVLDDFERALGTIKDAQSEHPAFNGVELIYSKFRKILERRGLVEIEAQDQPFDPEYHEAMTKVQAPSPEQKGFVIDVIEKGYKLNDKIIRHAKVVVGE